MKKKYLWLVFIATFLNFSLAQAQCDNITAPYTEDFDTAAGVIPDCWSQGSSNSENWFFDNDTGFEHIGNNGDFYGTTSASGDYFAWINDSSPNNTGTTLESPDVDVSGLSDPGISFYYVSDNEGNTNVDFSVDVYDGSSWNNDLFFSNTNTGGWKKVYVSFASLTITGDVKVRFVVDEIDTNSSTCFYDDLAIDDVVFEEMPDCIEPNGLTADTITSSGANLEWNPGSNETSWDVEVVTAGTTPTGTPTDSDVSNPFSVSGLSAQTNYEYYVRADCGADGVSAWAGPYAFTTACSSYLAPHIETFELSTTPLCWEESGATEWDYSTSVPAYAASGLQDHSAGGNTNYAVMDGSFNGSGEVSTLTSPFIDVSGLTKPGFQFYMFSNNTNDAAINVVDVEFYDGANWNNLTTVDDLLGDDWAFFIFDLSNYTITGDIQVRFTVTGSSVGIPQYNDIIIDDVEFLEAPDCIDPQNIEFSNIDLDNVDISWDDYANAGLWNIEYGPVGFTQGSTAGTVISGVTANPYNLDALTTGVEYDVYVQADCGNGDLSSWVGPASFETLKSGATCETAIDIASLPYTVTDTTSDYQDNYEGVAGTDCGESSENYLNGFETFYEFTPTQDDIVDITLSDITGLYAAVFVYESCSDVGAQCYAGAVAGPSDADFGIEELNVTGGNTYYVVVSSWLNPTIDYTLTIEGFECSVFPAPQGESPQDFVDGDVVADLEVETTLSPATIKWYSDSAGTNEITDPSSENLVDATTYYASQNFQGCESPLLPVLVNEIDCSTLEITSTTGNAVSCKGTMTLESESSGTGTETYWYDASTGGQLVGVGDDFTTPLLTNTTSYWATEVKILGPGPLAGQGIQTWNYGFASQIFSGVRGLKFNATESFTIVDVEIFSASATGAVMDVSLVDVSTGLAVQTVTNISTAQGTNASPVPKTIPLNFVVPGAGDYYLVAETVSGEVDMMYEYDFSGSNFPQALGSSGSITAGISGTFESTSSYYYFYNWTISEGELVCESTRKEAVATVNQSGDVVVGPLPYNTTDNTINYGNNFSGAPGTECGTTDTFLDGTDVVYEYTATEDNIIDIELSGVTNDTSGVFLYDSCGDVGVNCLEGAESDNGADFKIEDYPVTAGETYFIVISGSNGDNVGFTLDIYGFDCSDLNTPDGETTQYFVSGTNDLVEDLSVSEYVFSDGLNWYFDAAGTAPIADPSTEVLVDGETYYVSQTTLNCESDLLAITAVEFECNDLEVLSTTDGELCNSGSVLLEAENSGITGNIYWYDAGSAGSVVGVGEEFQTPSVSTTTSFWASEVFATSDDPISDLGKQTWSYGFGSGLFGSPKGIEFTATKTFVIVDVEVFSDSPGGGVMDVSLLNSSGDKVATATDISLPPGSDANPTSLTVDLNFTVPGPGTYQLVAEEISGEITMMYEYDFTNGVGYPISLGSSANLVNGVSGTFTYDYYYYYFYNWTIVEQTVICESERVESVVTVNTTIPDAPTGSVDQDLCEGQTLADIDLTGDNITWYDAASGGFMIPSDTEAEDGMTYYASQTVGSCESDETIAVTVSITPLSEVPVGDVNQAFSVGETIVDLDVTGDNLTWYADAEGTNVIPTSTELNDQETYYVSQTVTDQCESNLLPVTVHVGELSVGANQLTDLDFYPNPAKNQINITTSQSIDRVDFYNLLGQKVLGYSPGLSQVKLDVSKLSSGTYIMKVTSEGKSGLYKLIKE